MENAVFLRFAFKAYRRTFRVPVRTSHGVWTAREGLLLCVEREDGRVGFGEVAPIEWFGTESLAGALAWCAAVRSRVTAAELRNVPRGLPCCAAAVHAALDSLETPHSKPDAKPLPVACLLPAGEAARSALDRAADEGFATFKLKIGAGDIAREQTLVDRLAAQLPPQGRLRLDANGGLDVRGAIRWLDAAARWPVEFIEQPLAPSADPDLARLAGDFAVPLALDESVRGADDIRRWRDRGWQGVFVLKPALAGVPTDWMREVAVNPLQFVFSSALETAVGVAAGLRLAFASGITRALGYGVGAFFEDDGLGGGLPRATLAPGELGGMRSEDVWNRL